MIRDSKFRIAEAGRGTVDSRFKIQDSRRCARRDRSEFKIRNCRYRPTDRRCKIQYSRLQKPPNCRFGPQNTRSRRSPYVLNGLAQFENRRLQITNHKSHAPDTARVTLLHMGIVGFRRQHESVHRMRESPITNLQSPITNRTLPISRGIHPSTSAIGGFGRQDQSICSRTGNAAEP